MDTIIYIYRLYIYIERAITFNPGTEKGVYKIVEKRETVMIPHYLMLRDSIYLEGGIVKDELLGIRNHHRTFNN